MSVDRTSPVAPYRQVAEIIRDRIENGVYTVRLPGTRELAEEFEVAVLTARKAVRLLAGQGIVVISPGMGTYVKRPPPGDR